MKYDIITFGSATLDVFMQSDKLQVLESDKFATKKGICVPLGSKLHIKDVGFYMGGCGTNSAVTFGRQGLKTAYFGAIGKDVGGEQVKKVLKNNKVSLDLIEESNKYPTAFSVVLSVPARNASPARHVDTSHADWHSDAGGHGDDTLWVGEYEI